MMIVGKCKVVVGVATDPNDLQPDRTIDIDLLHIVKVEDLPAPSATGNGSG